MPDLNGIDVVVRMQRDGRDVPAIVITGGDEPKMRERCLKAGAAAYLIKPVERDTVFATIQSLSE
jgi:CheY-like chemotaxis protein